MAGDKPRPLPRDTDYYALLGDGKPISDEAAFTEIANTIMRLRHAFIRAGFQPPLAIELASFDDGYRMRHILPRDMILAFPKEGRDPDKDDVMFCLQGVEFRYPAHYRHPRKGTETI